MAVKLEIWKARQGGGSFVSSEDSGEQVVSWILVFFEDGPLVGVMSGKDEARPAYIQGLSVDVILVACVLIRRQVEVRLKKAQWRRLLS